MELRQLNTFITITQTRNFTKAADILGYAQSSVTTQIQQLEIELNVKLFDRIGKSIYLTPAGEKLLVYAKEILKLSDEIKNILTASDDVKGTIVLGTAESWCTAYFQQIYERFHEAFPDVEVKVKLCCNDELKKSLKENVVDIGLSMGDVFEDSDYVAEFKKMEPMALLVSPSHPLALKSTVFPEDLNGQPLILTESGCSYRNLFEDILNKAEVTPISILESESNQVIKQLTMSGSGITFLPIIAAKDELSTNKLVPLNWGGPSLNIFTQLTYHKDKWISPIIKAFCNTVIEVLSESESQN